MKFKIFLKICLFLFFGALLLEFSLRLYAFFTMSHESFAHFLQEAEQKIQAVRGRDVIYCVGDSTVQGLGASEPERYSMPAQLQNFVRQASPATLVLNLGYAGTCTEDHLKVLPLLPAESRVIYRGGISDKWNQAGDGFRFRMGNMVIESRLLKMLSIMFPGVFSLNPAKREELVRREFATIQKRKNLQIVTVDYTTYAKAASPDFFYLPEGSFPRINLREELSESDFMDNGVFRKSYVSVTGTHPNELGYYIESLFIFNRLCQDNLFGFRPEQARPAGNINDFSAGLQKRYDELKSFLQQLQLKDLLVSGQREQIRNMVKELWFLADLLTDIPGADNIYQRERLSIEKLSLFVFHDFRLLFTALAGMQSVQYESLPEKDRKEAQVRAGQYYTLLHFLVPPGAPSWEKVRQNIESLPFKVLLPEKPVTVLPDFYPYPLEFCPRFMRESSGFMPDVRVAEDWAYFFSIPYDKFNELTREFCH
jgi:hypothetical protein